MKRLLYLLLMLVFSLNMQAQFKITVHQEGWNNIPPQVQKKGFYFQQSILANMDGDSALEEIMLFGCDNGHYPTFDLFKTYYAIVDNYTKEVEYVSDVYITDKFNLIVEDRNNDSISELYITYFKDQKFSVDKQGYNLKAVRCYDRIEWNSLNKNFKTPEK